MKSVLRIQSGEKSESGMGKHPGSAALPKTRNFTQKFPVLSSVSDPKRLFQDPDPTLKRIPDPDPTLPEPIPDQGQNLPFLQSQKKIFLISFKSINQ